MISYKPFYETLFRKGITEYHLIFKEGFSASTLHRMKHGKSITTKTLDTLCLILGCEVSDIIEYLPDPESAGEET
ncbi:MAG: helix-turn-helix domain-containing protein [Butyricicoccaceae bacterium]